MLHQNIPKTEQEELHEIEAFNYVKFLKKKRVSSIVGVTFFQIHFFTLVAGLTKTVIFTGKFFQRGEGIFH